jgi:glutamyl-tRNA reductase
MERLVNAVIQASKKNKNDTEISSELSVSLQRFNIMKNVEDVGNKKHSLLEQVKLDVIPVKI